MTRSIRCPLKETCNKCKSREGKLLFKALEREDGDKPVKIEYPCPQIKGKRIPVEF